MPMHKEIQFNFCIPFLLPGFANIWWIKYTHHIDLFSKDFHKYDLPERRDKKNYREETDTSECNILKHVSVCEDKIFKFHDITSVEWVNEI